MYYQDAPRCILTNCLKFGTITDETAGEIVCKSCGRVWAERIETHEPQMHSMERMVGVTSVGAQTPLIMYDKGLRTTISKMPRDWNGKTISHHVRKNFVRLRTLDVECVNTSKNLRTALVVISTLATKLAIPDSVVERAAQICRKAMQNKLAKGRSTISVSCASLYTACREYCIPRTIDEISYVANIPKKITLQTYKALIGVLNIQPINHNLVAFLNRLANQANVSEQTKRIAFSILNENMHKMMGKNPNTVAATILYIACCRTAENKTQKLICDKAGICVTTIRSTINFLMPNTK